MYDGLGTVVHTWSLSAWELEARESWIWDQLSAAIYHKQVNKIEYMIASHEKLQNVSSWKHLAIKLSLWADFGFEISMFATILLCAYETLKSSRFIFDKSQEPGKHVLPYSCSACFGPDDVRLRGRRLASHVWTHMFHFITEKELGQGIVCLSGERCFPDFILEQTWACMQGSEDHKMPWSHCKLNLIEQTLNQNSEKACVR